MGKDGRRQSSPARSFPREYARKRSVIIRIQKSSLPSPSVQLPRPKEPWFAAECVVARKGETVLYSRKGE